MTGPYVGVPIIALPFATLLTGSEIVPIVQSGITRQTTVTAIASGPSFGGTVQQISTGTGLTGGPITLSGTVSFAPIAANTLLANPTGASGVPVATPLGSNLAFSGGALVTSGLGGGTVTSVALTVPNILLVTGSPITTAGTLAVSLATQSANLVFAGPTSGVPATPTFRSLVSSDIPSNLYIRLDGTSATTAEIPFAHGIFIPQLEEIRFGTSGSNIQCPAVGTDLDITAAGTMTLGAGSQIQIGQTAGGLSIVSVQNTWTLGSCDFQITGLSPNTFKITEDSGLTDLSVIDTQNLNVTFDNIGNFLVTTVGGNIIFNSDIIENTGYWKVTGAFSNAVFESPVQPDFQAGKIVTGLGTYTYDGGAVTSSEFILPTVNVFDGSTNFNIATFGSDPGFSQAGMGYSLLHWDGASQLGYLAADEFLNQLTLWGGNFTGVNADALGGFPPSAFVLASRTISTTSPLRIDGGASADLSANRTLSFDFSTNNTWTGTFLHKNTSNSTTSFMIQDSAGTKIFTVDTTNKSFGFGSVGAATTALFQLTDTNATPFTNLLSFSRGIATRVIATELLMSVSHSWTGAGTGTLAAIRCGSWLITDSRTINSGTGDLLTGLRLNATRSSSFSTSTLTSATTIGLDFVATEGGTYTTNAASVSAALEVLRASGTWSPICNVGGGNTFTYDYYGTKNQLTTVAPTQTSGTLVMRYRGFADLTVGTTTGTTLNASFYSSASNWDTLWFLWNDRANNSYLGFDNSKTYWGTGSNTLSAFTGGIGDCSITFTGAAMRFKSNEITSTDYFQFDGPGMFIGGTTAPTAILHLAAGTTTANTGPLKFTSGTNLTTAESGIVEYNNRHYFSNSSLLRFPVGGTLFDHFSDAGNVGTGEDDLYSDTLAVNTLASDGDKIIAHYGGVFNGAALSTQELRVYFGGTKIYDSGALAIGAATNAWTVNVVVIRESATVVRCNVSVSTDFATLFPYSTYTRITGLTLSNTQILKITGEAAGAGAVNDQIVAKEGYIVWEAAK